MRILAFVPLVALISCGATAERPYQLPYVSGTEVLITNDHEDHSTPVAEMFDMRATDPGQTLVAAGDGWIRELDDTKDSSSTTNNYIWIEHPLNYCQPVSDIVIGPAPTPGNCETCRDGLGKCNEWTLYAHMAQDSVTDLGLGVGSWVTQGQPIGIEGDVGFTPCGGSTSPNCGRHLHFALFTIDRTSGFANGTPTVNGDYESYANNEVLFGSGERPERVPLFCTAAGLRLVETGETYVAGPCP